MAPLPESLQWITLEHEVARILTEQEFRGWTFNERLGQELESELRSNLENIVGEILEEIHFFPKDIFTPKRNNRTLGYIEGCQFCRFTDFNPTSRDHIAWALKTKEGWKPKKATETNKPVVDEDVLVEWGTPRALQFAEALKLTKQLGMLSEGKNAWLKLVRNGRIHHHCSVSTNTHRCAHRNPNLAQVPSDLRFRRLFEASKGKVMVGADLSGIELRMFAHYLARYDGGRYGDILLNGDIHQVNAEKIGISRRQVKTVTYAFLYGAGDMKIGLSYDPQLSPKEAKSRGADIRVAFMDAIDGLERLVSDVKAKASAAGRINSIDGRPIPVDSPHKALNYLLQSGAGIIAKMWMVKAQFPGADQLAFIHDELQFECPPEKELDLRCHLVQSAAEAGETYRLRIPIAAEAKSGQTWADVH